MHDQSQTSLSPFTIISNRIVVDSTNKKTLHLTFSSFTFLFLFSIVFVYWFLFANFIVQDIGKLKEPIPFALYSQWNRQYHYKTITMKMKHKRYQLYALGAFVFTHLYIKMNIHMKNHLNNCKKTYVAGFQF